jgi:hypothetical protein
MGNELDRLAIEAEADRLSGVYLRVRLLAQARRIEFEAAGREAVANGVVSAADWDVIREAVGGR